MAQVLHRLCAEKVHATRLTFNSEKLQQSNLLQEWLYIAEGTEDCYEMVHCISDIVEADDGIFLQLQWGRLSETQEWTWSLLDHLFEDLPDMGTSFLSSHESKRMILLKLRPQPSSPHEHKFGS